MSEPKPNPNAATIPTQGQPFEVFAAQRAIFESSLTSSEKIVALAVVHHMNADGECWPSIVRISRIASVARSTVSVALRGLVNLGWLDRQQRLTRGGDRDSTLYRWKGCPMSGLPAQRVTRTSSEGSPASERRSPDHRAQVARQPGTNNSGNNSHKTSQENKPRGGKAPPDLSLSEAWEAVLAAYIQQHESYYETKVLPDRLSKPDREDIARFFLKAAEEARGEWPGAEKDSPLLPLWVSYVAKHVLAKWIQENEGINEYLRSRHHPLRELRSDLARAYGEWLDDWREKVAKASAPAP